MTIICKGVEILMNIEKVCKGLPKEALEEIKKYFQYEVKRIDDNIEALEKEREESENYIIDISACIFEGNVADHEEELKVHITKLNKEGYKPDFILVI